MADKLNFFRYILYFRCVYRGFFFSEMRITVVRKFFFEVWGKIVRDLIWYMLVNEKKFLSGI